MNENENTKEAADFLVALMKAKGVACSTTKDGHLLMFKRSFLQAILNANPDKDEFVIMVKRPDFEPS